ncbi:MAG: sugar transferase [Oscillospiraceae bacterium]|jgi:exopolysaccharide biosynthesis polyprenyl glycosylphosphotransferase|nr:sugar transferase [Oscillospiraceae bacterium]
MQKFADAASDIDFHAYAQRRLYLLCKRIFDVLFSIISVLILWPFMLLLAVIIKADSAGTAFFKQTRLGYKGKSFTMYKFRSMRLDAEKDGPKWASEEDSRTTKVGRFIRKTRLDELPQLFNIIRGDMSFVGPRPERAVFYDEFDAYIEGYRKRMLVLPGLTGWAQINGGYNLGAEHKIVYDMEYVRKYSFLLDVKIIFLTFKVVFTGEGAR